VRLKNEEQVFVEIQLHVAKIYPYVCVQIHVHVVYRCINFIEFESHSSISNLLILDGQVEHLYNRLYENVASLEHCYSLCHKELGRCPTFRYDCMQINIKIAGQLSYRAWHLIPMHAPHFNSPQFHKQVALTCSPR